MGVDDVVISNPISRGYNVVITYAKLTLGVLVGSSSKPQSVFNKLQGFIRDLHINSTEECC